jgi:inhibitor of cysteine peptidase
MKRHFYFVLALLFAASGADASDAVLKLATGGRASISLTENPSTGYSWRIDREQSANLEILRLDDGGFVRGDADGPRIGAPGKHRWSVEALSRGRATIGFVYQRPWENAPARTHRVTVQVKGR